MKYRFAPDAMDKLQRAINDLVIANRILAHHGVFDEYGHVSVRHPGDPGRFLLARDCAAAFVEPGDILDSRSTARRPTTTTGRSAPSASCMPRSMRRGRR